MNPHRLFVYGTLRKGGSNHFRMVTAELVGRGSIGGRIYRITWFPALVCGGGGSVKGEVYRVSDKDLEALDRFEGPDYHRREVPVRMDDGGETTAFVWEWRGDLNGATPLEGDDWLAYEPSAG